MDKTQFFHNILHKINLLNNCMKLGTRVYMNYVSKIGLYFKFIIQIIFNKLS